MSIEELEIVVLALIQQVNVIQGRLDALSPEPEGQDQVAAGFALYRARARAKEREG
jgi:hypothetical protein